MLFSYFCILHSAHWPGQWSPSLAYIALGSAGRRRGCTGHRDPFYWTGIDQPKRGGFPWLENKHAQKPPSIWCLNRIKRLAERVGTGCGWGIIVTGRIPPYKR